MTDRQSFYGETSKSFVRKVFLEENECTGNGTIIDDLWV